MGEERGTNIMSGRASLEPETILNNDKISIALWELQECLNNLQKVLQEAEHKAQEEQAHENK